MAEQDLLTVLKAAEDSARALAAIQAAAFEIANGHGASLDLDRAREALKEAAKSLAKARAAGKKRFGRPRRPPSEAKLREAMKKGAETLDLKLRQTPRRTRRPAVAR